MRRTSLRLAIVAVLALSVAETWRSRDRPIPLMTAAIEPRVMRITLEPPDIRPLHPPRLPARQPRNRYEALVAPYERWVHPIPDDLRWLPGDESMRFGAPRGGVRLERCGRGHCGDDLGAPRSTPIVAIGDGVVERVEKDRRERAGWYVSVAHDGGRVVSKYMHLDFIRDDLAAGVPVKAGEWLGSLGKTGVHSSGPHLHFEVTVRLSKKQERRVDPEPLLRAADVIGLLEMKPGAHERP